MIKRLSQLAIIAFLISCSGNTADVPEANDNISVDTSSRIELVEALPTATQETIQEEITQEKQIKNYGYDDIDFVNNIPVGIAVSAELMTDWVNHDLTQYNKKETKINFDENTVIFKSSKSSEGVYPDFHSEEIEPLNIINKSSLGKGIIQLKVKNIESNTYFIGETIIIDFNIREIKWLKGTSQDASYTWNNFSYKATTQSQVEIAELLIYNGYRPGSSGLQQDKVILTSDLKIKHYIIDWDSKFENSTENIEAEYYPINYEIVKKEQEITGILVKCANTPNEALKNKAVYVIDFSLKNEAIIFIDPSHNYSVGEISNIHLGTYPTNENFEGKGFTMKNLDESLIQFSK